MHSTLLHADHGLTAPGHFQPPDTSAVTRLVSNDLTISRAELYVDAARDADTPPLTVLVNDSPVQVDGDLSAPGSRWYRGPVDPALLEWGNNEILVAPQPGWQVMTEPSTELPVIRLRVWSDTVPSEPRPPRYGDPAISASPGEWLAHLPVELRNGPADDAGIWDWCWQLAGWTSRAWPYTNTADGSLYAPWDARTILRWAGGPERAALGETPIMMCVHYAVVFIQLATAAGVTARAAVLTPELGSSYGHFVAEVWLPTCGRWAMIDPNMHFCFRDPTGAGIPLATAELWARRDELSALLETGPGFDAQSPRLRDFATGHCFRGRTYRLWGIWARHDWIDRPEQRPPAHGAAVYAETDIIWAALPEFADDLAMFPHLVTAADLAEAPPASE
jgi:hypothetical protein